MSERMGMSAELLDELCANWPGSSRSIKWDVDLVWSVSNKMFVILCLLGPERGRLSFKVDPGRFLELTDRPGISSAPYMARAYWVSINEPGDSARRNWPITSASPTNWYAPACPRQPNVYSV